MRISLNTLEQTHFGRKRKKCEPVFHLGVRLLAIYSVAAVPFILLQEKRKTIFGTAAECLLHQNFRVSITRKTLTEEVSLDRLLSLIDDRLFYVVLARLLLVIFQENCSGPRLHNIHR